MTSDDSISIWFFIGVLVTFYGVVILGYGLSVINVPVPERALSYLHPDIWWGGLMAVIGAFYSVKYFPGKRG